MNLDVYKRQSQSKGGYPIDFVMEFYGKSFPEAVQLLTGESGEGQSEASTAPHTAFHLPLHNRTADRAIQYLTESRGLNKDVYKRQEALHVSVEWLKGETDEYETDITDKRELQIRDAMGDILEQLPLALTDVYKRQVVSKRRSKKCRTFL